MRDDDPTLEKLFEAARSVERPSDGERARHRKRLAARLAATGAVVAVASTAGEGSATGALGAGADSAASAAATPTVQATLGGSLAHGVIGVALIAAVGSGALGIAARWVLSDNARSGAPATAPPSARTAAPSVEAAPSAAAAPAAPAADQALPRSRPASSLRASAPGAPAASAVDPLAAELTLVRSAQQSLDARQSRRALALLDQYFRRFPGGALGPEARALRVKALCVAGRDMEAAREARQFVRTHPSSPLVARVGGGCKPR